MTIIALMRESEAASRAAGAHEAHEPDVGHALVRDHTVYSDDPKDKDFRSDNLGNGDTYSHKFDKAGKFPYHCKYHPRMHGTVTVSD